MNNLYKDIARINSAVKLYWKVVIWSVIMLALYAVSVFSKSDFLLGFFSVVIPFMGIFSAIIYVSALSGNNYILISTLPVNMKNITGIIFRLYEITCVIIFIGCSIIAVISGGLWAVAQQLINTLITLSFGYLVIWGCSSAELQIGFAQGANTLKSFFGGMGIYFAFIALSLGRTLLFDKLEKNPFFLIIVILLIAFFSIIAILVRKLSYNKAYAIIRGIAKKK